jgi:hypothetical protein
MGVQVDATIYAYLVLGGDDPAAIKKALNSGRFLLPMHDLPARIRTGRWLRG